MPEGDHPPCERFRSAFEMVGANVNADARAAPAALDENIAPIVNSLDGVLPSHAKSAIKVAEHPAEVPASDDGAAASATADAIVGLPRNEYYRASKLGEGTYGSVVTVFDEDGNSWAAKVFSSEEDADTNSDSEDSEEEWTPKSNSGIEVGVLRELSILRFLNAAHPNIMHIVDITQMDNSLCLIMPRAAGALNNAILKQTLSGALKLRVATLLLGALKLRQTAPTIPFSNVSTPHY